MYSSHVCTYTYAQYRDVICIYILGYIYMSHTPHMFSHELSCLCLHGGSLIQKHRWFSQDGWPDPKWPNKSGPTSCTGIYLFSVSEGPNFIKLQLVRITILDFWPPRFVVSKHPTIRFDPLGHSHVWTPSMGNGPPPGSTAAAHRFERHLDRSFVKPAEQTDEIQQGFDVVWVDMMGCSVRRSSCPLKKADLSVMF